MGATPYIWESLVSLHGVRLPRRLESGGGPLMDRVVPALRGWKRLLEDKADRPAYAFTPAALNAAADLRIDTPARLERMMAAVFDRPRKLFLEAPAPALARFGEDLRGFLGPVEGAGHSAPARWGAFVDILGDGRSRVRVVHAYPPSALRDEPAVAECLRDLRAVPPRVREVARQLVVLRPAMQVGEIDPHRAVPLARDEFDRLVSSADPAADPLLVNLSAAMRATPGVRARARLHADAWRTMRLRALVAARPDPIEALSAQSPMAGLWSALSGRSENPALHHALVQAVLPVLGMAAVLEADPAELGLTRPSRPGRARAPRPYPSGDRLTDAPSRVSVVTLNLSDRGMQEVYDQPGGPARDGEKSEESPGAGRPGMERARHPVRGHLFLARNGRLTWRRPHWRGSLDKPRLHRVTASTS